MVPPSWHWACWFAYAVHCVEEGIPAFLRVIFIEVYDFHDRVKLLREVDEEMQKNAESGMKPSPDSDESTTKPNPLKGEQEEAVDDDHHVGSNRNIDVGPASSMVSRKRTSIISSSYSLRFGGMHSEMSYNENENDIHFICSDICVILRGISADVWAKFFKINDAFIDMPTLNCTALDLLM